MTPSQVKDIISKTEEDHTTDGEEGTDELGILNREGTRVRSIYWVIIII